MASLKDWIENKIASEMGLHRLYHLDMFCAIKETEKAVYVLFYTGYNSNGSKATHRTHWVPKSAIENIEDLRTIPDYDEAIKEFEKEYNM